VEDAKVKTVTRWLIRTLALIDGISFLVASGIEHLLLAAETDQRLWAIADEVNSQLAQAMTSYISESKGDLLPA
jgi:hypothetical protein